MLLQSESGKYPNGLANSMNQAGRYYMRYTTGSVFGVMTGPLYWNRGTQMAGLIEDRPGMHHQEDSRAVTTYRDDPARVRSLRERRRLIDFLRAQSPSGNIIWDYKAFAA